MLLLDAVAWFLTVSSAMRYLRHMLLQLLFSQLLLFQLWLLMSVLR
jgi:hypothetical protein